MQKRIITLLIISILMIVLPVEAKTLKGEVRYTVKQAREEAFSNVEYTLPESIIKSNLIDPNYKENKKAIKIGATELSDRFITIFSDGEYGVIYKNNFYFEYYYSSKGKLISIGKRNRLIYPVITYIYNQYNELTTVSLIVNETNTYNFRPDGKLDSHWVNNNCYDINGNLVLTRD